MYKCAAACSNLKTLRLAQQRRHRSAVAARLHESRNPLEQRRRPRVEHEVGRRLNVLLARRHLAPDQAPLFRSSQARAARLNCLGIYTRLAATRFYPIWPAERAAGVWDTLLRMVGHPRAATVAAIPGADLRVLPKHTRLLAPCPWRAALGLLISPTYRPPSVKRAAHRTPSLILSATPP